MRSVARLAVAAMLVASSSLVTLGSRAASQASPSAEVAALWARALAAKGGTEPLRATRSVLIRWRRGRSCAVDLLVPPSKKWSWQDGRANELGVVVERIDLDDALHTHQTRPSGRGERLVGRIWPHHQEQVVEPLLAAFLETASLRPTPIAVEPRGKDTLLRAEWQGGPIDYVLDPQARPKEVIFYRPPPRDVEVRWVLRDYRRVGGLDLPHRVDEEIDGRGTGSRRLEYHINPRYDPRVLRLPPSLAAGPNGWARVIVPPANDDLRLYEKTAPKGCGAPR